MKRDRLTVGDARRVLGGSADDLLTQPDVYGVGVGLRNQQAAFILTVRDPEAKRRYDDSYANARRADLPVNVELSSFMEVSTPVAREFDAGLLPRRGVRDRVRGVFAAVGSLFAP